MTEKTDDKAKRDELEALKKRHTQIAARIKELEAKRDVKKRKEDTRLKVLIGAAIIADFEKQFTDNRQAAEKERDRIKAVLSRAIQRKQDREFLKAAGWLD